MDAQQYFGYGFAGADLSYSYSSSSYPTVPSMLDRHIGSLKSESWNSPDSPFSSSFDTEILTKLSETKEQHFSTETALRSSPSCSSSQDYNNYFQQSSPSLGCCVDNPQLYTNGAPLVVSGSHGNINHVSHGLESALMESDYVGVSVPKSSYGEANAPQVLGEGYSTWSQQDHMAHVIQSQLPRVLSYQYENGAPSDKHQKEIGEVSSWGIPAGNLKQLLIACARALSENRLYDFEKLAERARGVVSIAGEPIQRLGAYMVEGLVARKEASGTNIYRSLRCKEPEGKDLLTYMHILYEICPYLKFGYMAANGAIAEACRNEDRIHIIDFQIAQGTQWVTLLQALAARPSGTPYVRITGVDDPVSKHARGVSLEAVGKRLEAISAKFNIPVEFHAVSVFAPYVTKDMLDVRPGEVLAVNFPLQLHHTPDESVDVNNPRDGLLRMVKSLHPKIVTLVEQESNTNTAPFFPRFLETLEYYSAVFESIDAALSRDRKERINVEQHCLARDIVNIIACEGKERVERHELFGKWKSRMTMAGFQQYPLSSYMNSVLKSLLRSYSQHYKLEEKDGVMLLGWKNRNLISASAWH